jgi:RHS repeat-associated protein
MGGTRPPRLSPGGNGKRGLHFRYSEIMPAATENTASTLFPLAAIPPSPAIRPLAKNSHQGLALQTPSRIGPAKSLSSTLHWGSWQIYDGTAVDRLVGLDYFGARYFSGAQGRFTSPDPGSFGSALADPQSWNAYAYGRNNPLKYTDPTGLAYTVCQTDSDGNKSNCGTVDDKNDKSFLQSLNDSGLSMTAGGRILNGSGDQVGTASYFSQAQQNSDSQAAQFLTNQVGPLVNGLGYATGGVLLGAGAGAAYGAIAGGSTALSIPVTSGGTATAAGYQLLKDSYKNLELAGEALSGVGQRIIAAGDEIRDVPRLVSQYGGKASDWVKLSTSGIDPSKMQIYAQQAGRGTPIQMHYYKNIVTGAIVEMKSVFTGIQ